MHIFRETFPQKRKDPLLVQWEIFPNPELIFSFLGTEYNCGINTGFVSKQTQVRIPDLSFTSCVIFVKLINRSELFSYL